MTLAKDTADLVARHLVMAGRLVDEDPTAALAHARAARALAGRVGAVRETNGLVAYLAGEWAEALSELRTARRLTGEPDHLPVIADCERALGRPDRALMVVDDPQAAGLSPAARVELLIVASGARRDLGQAEAAVIALQVAALEGPVRPWTARLRYAYADALLEAGREDDARQWFARAADVDEAGETDAEERLLALDGVELEDLLDESEEEDADEAGPVPAEDLAALAAGVVARRSEDTAARVGTAVALVEPSGDVQPDTSSSDQAPAFPELPGSAPASPERDASIAVEVPEASTTRAPGAPAAADGPEGQTAAAVDAEAARLSAPASSDDLSSPFLGGAAPAEEERRAAPTGPVSAPGFREPPAAPGPEDSDDEHDDLTLFD